MSEQKQTLPIARYVLRARPLVAEFDDQSPPIFGEVVLLATQVEGQGIEIQPSVHFFGPGVESARGFTERLYLQASGPALWLPGNEPDIAQDLAFDLRGALLADGFMRDPERPDRFRLQRTGEKSCCYMPTEDAIILLEGHLTGTLNFGQPLDARLIDRELYVREAGQLHARIELAVTSENPPFDQIFFEMAGPIMLDQVVLSHGDSQEAGGQYTPAPIIFVPPIPAPAPPAPPAFPVAAPQAICSQRTLWMQRVFFSDNAVQTGDSSQQQMDSAEIIWGKACLAIAESDEPQTIANAGLAQSSAIATICAAAAPPVGVIPIFFVDNDLANDGGGATILPGTPLARVVVSDHILGDDGFGTLSTNPALLAHELGHVLGGVHPNELPQITEWLGAMPSILEASGIPWQMASDRNPLENCVHAYNVAAQPHSDPPTPDCVMSPDP